MLQMNKLTDPGETYPIIFCYDCITSLPPDLEPPSWTFNNPYEHCDEVAQLRRHSFPLFPREANLPFHSGVPVVRVNRYISPAMEYAERLFRAFSEDEGLRKIPLVSGGTVADIAARQLKKPPMERLVIAAMITFPYCDEERMKLVATATMMFFFFDDAHQEVKAEVVKYALEDFGKRLTTDPSHGSLENVALQGALGQMVQGFRSADSIAGNGGREVVESMCGWIQHDQPEKDFGTVEEYMAYRWDDSGFEWVSPPSQLFVDKVELTEIRWICACVKFSIASSLDLKDPKLMKFMSLARDHSILINDLASFDKELKDFEAGKATSMINAVYVIQQVYAVDASEAKVQALVMRTEIEREIQKELEVLEGADALSMREWQFVEGMLAMLGGYLFYTMTASRYGGEASRVDVSKYS